MIEQDRTIKTWVFVLIIVGLLVVILMNSFLLLSFWNEDYDLILKIEPKKQPVRTVYAPEVVERLNYDINLTINEDSWRNKQAVDRLNVMLQDHARRGVD